MHNLFPGFRITLTRTLTAGLASVFASLLCTTPAQCQQLAAYLWSAANSEHVVYIGTDSHIHELYSSGNGQWQQNDLNTDYCIPVSRPNPPGGIFSIRPELVRVGEAPPLASNPYGSISGFVWSADNSEHVVYIGQNGHLYDLSYKPGGCWNHTDLTAQVPGTPLPDGATGIVGYDWPEEGTEHFAYAGQDGFIHEIFQGIAGGWGRSDFNTFPLAAGPIAGYVWPSDRSEHIVYTGPTGAVNELYEVLGGGWQLNTSFGGNNNSCCYGSEYGQGVRDFFTASGTALTGYVWPEDNTEHIAYVDPAGKIPELWYQSSLGWNSDQINSSNTSYNSQAVSGYVWPSNHSEHVLSVDFNGHVHEYYLNRNTNHQWDDNDITGSASGNPPQANPSGVAGFAWDAQSIEHAFYFDCNGHVNDAFYTGAGPNWSNQDLTQLTGANPAFGCPD